jgi:hypothetical protein
MGRAPPPAPDTAIGRLMADRREAARSSTGAA